MAKLVLAIGTSHGPMLGSPAEDIPLHGARDEGNGYLVNRAGKATTFEDLKATADPAWRAELAPDVISAKMDRCQAGIARLAEILHAADPDAVIVVGDDQHEQLLEDNLPALMVYAGAEIENGLLDLPEDAPAYWKRARQQYHELEQPRSYPVARDLALHAIRTFIALDFDPAVSHKLPRARGEGHAFGFVHRRLMVDRIVPVVPVMMNTYFPPNQPTPRRCADIGRALATAIETFPEEHRIAMIASGGLTHFAVDADFDRAVMAAFCAPDAEALAALPATQLNSGTSEIRNWIAAGAAAAEAGLKETWSDYVPMYRTEAGTGCGIGFAALM